MPNVNQNNEAVVNEIRALIVQSKSVNAELRKCTFEQLTLLIEKLTNLAERLRNPKPSVSDPAFRQQTEKFQLVAKTKAELATHLEETLASINQIMPEKKSEQLLNAVLYDEDLLETPFIKMDYEELTDFIAKVRTKLNELEAANADEALIEKVKSELVMLGAIVEGKRFAAENAAVQRNFPEGKPNKNAAPKNVRFDDQHQDELPPISKGVFGKGFIARAKSYAKAHPVKFALIVGAVAVGVGLFIAGCVMTAGALAVVGTTAATAAGLSSSFALSAAAAAAAAPGLVVATGGVTAAATGVAALGISTNNHAWKKLIGQTRQVTLDKLSSESHSGPKRKASVLKPAKALTAAQGMLMQATTVPIENINDKPATIKTLIKKINDQFTSIKASLNNAVLLSDLKLLEKNEIPKFKATFAATIESFEQAQKLGSTSPEYTQYVEEYKKLIREIDDLVKQKNEELLPNTPEKIYRERYHKLLKTNYAGTVTELNEFYLAHQEILQRMNDPALSTAEKLTLLTPAYRAIIKKREALDASISAATKQRFEAEATRSEAKAEVEFLSLHVLDARTILSDIVAFYNDAHLKALAANKNIVATMHELILAGDKGVSYLQKFLKKAGKNPVYLSDLSKSEFKELFKAVESIRQLINAVANIDEQIQEHQNAVMARDYMPMFNIYSNKAEVMARQRVEIQKLLKNKTDNLTELNSLLESKKAAVVVLQAQPLADKTYSDFAADISVQFQKVQMLFDKEMTEGISLQRLKERAEHDPELIEDLDLFKFIYYYELKRPEELSDQTKVTIAALAALAKTNPEDTLQIRLTEPLITLLQAINQTVSLSIANTITINQNFEKLINNELSIDGFIDLFKKITNISLKQDVFKKLVDEQKAQQITNNEIEQKPDFENNSLGADNPAEGDKVDTVEIEEEKVDIWAALENAKQDESAEKESAPALEETEAEHETENNLYAKLTATAQAHLHGKSVSLNEEIDCALNASSITANEKIYLQLVKKFTDPNVQAMLLVLNMAPIAGSADSEKVIAAIKRSNHLQYSDVNVNLETLLQDAGFDVQSSDKPALNKLLQLIIKPSLLNKLNNTALKKLLAADRQILLSEEQIESLNNLTAAGFEFSRFCSELKTIVGDDIVLPIHTFKDINAEHQLLATLTVPITFASECDRSFKALQGQLPNLHKAFSDFNKKQRLPLFLKKMFDKKTISFAQLGDACTQIANYRAWFKQLMQLQQISNSSNPELLNNIFGDKTADLIDFLKQHTDEIKEHKFLLFEKTDLLLRKSLVHFLARLTDESNSLKEAFKQLSDNKKLPTSKLKWLKNVLEIKQAVLESAIDYAKNLIRVLEQQFDLPDEVKKLRDFVTETNELLQSIPEKISALTQQLTPQSSAPKTAAKSSKITIETTHTTDANAVVTSPLATTQTGTAFTQVNEDHSRTVRLVEANGLSYKILSNGNGVYERPNNYLKQLLDVQIKKVKKRGYSDDEEHVIESMTLNLVTAFLKTGKTKLYIRGNDTFCEKAALYALAILPPEIDIYVNNSTKPFKPKGWMANLEVKKQREMHKQDILAVEDILNNDTDALLPAASTYKARR